MALAVAAVILIGGGSGQGERGGAGEDPAAQNPQQPTNEEAGQPTPTEEAPDGVDEQAAGDPETDGELGTPALGDEDAPVVMVEYSDYQ